MSFNIKLKTIYITVIMINFYLPINVYAAIDGTLGQNSVGQSEVYLTLEEAVNIIGIDDINFGDWNSQENLINEDEICIYSTSSKYQISAISSSFNINNEQFVVISDNISNSNNFIPFNVYWNDENSDIGKQIMQPGQVLSNQSGADNQSFTCNGGYNARLIVEFSKENLVNAVAGEYYGSLTLSISLE